MMKPRKLGKTIKSELGVVVGAESSEEALRSAEARADCGVEAIEITFTVLGAARVIAKILQRFTRDQIVVATVLDPETARAATPSGAQFVVSSSLNPEAARLCNRYQILYIPGASTLREVIEGMEYGADIAKVFPGEALCQARARPAATKARSCRPEE